MTHSLNIDGCDVVIGEGLANSDPIVLGERSAVAVLHQPGVPAMIAAEIQKRIPAAKVFELPDGEAAKSLEVASGIYRWMNRIGMTRSDAVVGVGGGAATDLAGFVAATYLRGVEAIYVPTTLLAAVDASIGGKTGVNVDGKNLVGVFSHPARVVIDTEILAAVDPAITRQGHAEAVKAAFIGESDLLELYERSGLQADLTSVVVAAVGFKAEVVSEDWKESGRRAILNYGHTAGHAVEVVGAMPHGDAVAIGMRIAADLSQTLVGFEDRDRQVDLIERLGLPTGIPGLPVADLMELVDLDKKRDTQGLRMVLLEGFGRPVVRHVAPDDLTAAMVAAGATEQ